MFGFAGRGVVPSRRRATARERASAARATELAESDQAAGQTDAICGGSGGGGGGGGGGRSRTDNMPANGHHTTANISSGSSSNTARSVPPRWSPKPTAIRLDSKSGVLSPAQVSGDGVRPRERSDGTTGQPQMATPSPPAAGVGALDGTASTATAAHATLPGGTASVASVSGSAAEAASATAATHAPGRSASALNILHLFEAAQDTPSTATTEPEATTNNADTHGGDADLRSDDIEPLDSGLQTERRQPKTSKKKGAGGRSQPRTRLKKRAGRFRESMAAHMEALEAESRSGGRFGTSRQHRRATSLSPASVFLPPPGVAADGDVLLQFGRLSNSRFFVDCSAPTSPVQAFGMALSQFWVV